MLALLTAGLSSAQEDTVVEFADTDPEMNEAIARARATLPSFWARFSNPSSNEEGFLLKLAISDGDLTEHFWCSDIEGSSARATCVIANEPQEVHIVEYLQRIDVDPALISDWMYKRDGKIEGAETLRVIVTRLPAEEAAVYVELLSDWQDAPAQLRVPQPAKQKHRRR